MKRKRSWDCKKWRDCAVPGDYVRLSATAVAIVDTPVFQRLRFLKQLGMTEFVYPGASHTRFAHSLGVAHRAKEFALRLAAKQPELELTDSDLLVLEVAGLCHDLGHGPFSHSFQTELVPKLLPPGEHWEHEEQSCILLDHICEQYSGVDLNPEEQQRVKDLMLGDREKAKADWRGKEWQLDIVANKRNGLDVDKLDYLRRDNLAVGELTTSEFSALYENMRVVGGEVCFRHSVRSAVQDVYSARAKLHEYVYTHPVAKAVEYMVVDALLLVAAELGILEALRSPERFALLDDTIVRDIERSRSETPAMRRAQELLRRLRHRDIYKHCGSTDVPPDLVRSFPAVAEEEVLQHQDPAAAVHLQPGDIRIHNLKIDYTTQHRNPIESVGFYVGEDDELKVPMRVKEQPFAPGTFIVRQVRIFLVRLCDTSEEKRLYQQAVQAAFGRWSQQVLGAPVLVSPQKSTVTASDRKRSHRSCSLLGGSALSDGVEATAAAAPDDDEVVALSQSNPAPERKIAKKGLHFS